MLSICDSDLFSSCSVAVISNELLLFYVFAMCAQRSANVVVIILK